MKDKAVSEATRAADEDVEMEDEVPAGEEEAVRGGGEEQAPSGQSSVQQVSFVALLYSFKGRQPVF